MFWYKNLQFQSSSSKGDGVVFLNLSMFILIWRTNHNTLVKDWKHYCKYSTWFLKEQSYNHLQVHSQTKSAIQLKKIHAWQMPKIRSLAFRILPVFTCYHVLGTTASAWLIQSEMSFLCNRTHILYVQVCIYIILYIFIYKKSKKQTPVLILFC